MEKTIQVVNMIVYIHVPKKKKKKLLLLDAKHLIWRQIMRRRRLQG
jgi:hypothetical protein